jgi:hypothetical protein
MARMAEMTPYRIHRLPSRKLLAVRPGDPGSGRDSNPKGFLRGK